MTAVVAVGLLNDQG